MSDNAAAPAADAPPFIKNDPANRTSQPTQAKKPAAKKKSPAKPKAAPKPKAIPVGKGRSAITHLMPEILNGIIAPRMMACLNAGAGSFRDIINAYSQFFGVTLSESTVRQWCKDCGIQFQMRMMVTAPPTTPQFVHQPQFNQPRPQPTHFNPQTQQQMLTSVGGQDDGRGRGGFGPVTPAYSREGQVSPMPNRLATGFSPFPGNEGGSVPLRELAAAPINESPFAPIK